MDFHLTDYQMKTYQVFKDNCLVGDRVSIEEARKHLTAGSSLISGNKIDKISGEIELRSIHKLREGGKVTIIENT